MSKPIYIQKLVIQQANQKPYAQILNMVLQEITNTEAGFIWAYLQSLPPTWEVHRNHLRRKFKMGEVKYKKIMAFLKKSNLIDYIQERDENNHFTTSKIFVKDGNDFIQVPSDIANIVPDAEMKAARTESIPAEEVSVNFDESYPQSAGIISVRTETRTDGTENHINKTSLINPTPLIDKTFDRSNFFEYEELKDLLEREFNQSPIHNSQAKKVIDQHITHVNMTHRESILLSIENFKNYIKKKKVPNPIGYFIKTISKENFFGDTIRNTVEKDPNLANNRVPTTHKKTLPPENYTDYLQETIRKSNGFAGDTCMNISNIYGKYIEV